MISVSYLAIKDDFKNNLLKLDNLNIDYIHVDVMDGLFVDNKTKDVTNELLLTKHKKDVHLMVKDVKKYVDIYKMLNPEYITFHIEVGNTLELINYIKSNNIKAGLAINPETNIELLLPFLPLIDQVLIMSVHPGYGGQSFIPTSLDKIDYLKKHRFNYVINIDGGINNETIRLVDTDIKVVGSYITNGDYKTRLEECLKEL